MSKPVIVIGGGGHARVVMETLLRNHVSIIGICDPALAPSSTGPFGVPILGDDTALDSHGPSKIELVNGVGSTQSTRSRRQVFDTLGHRGYRFATVVHPSVIMADDVVLEEGAQVMAGAVVQTGVVIGRNAIVNTGARIDHDCRVGDHVHVAPGATLSGGVCIGAGTHIGAAAVIIQSVTVGENCLIGAGTVVLRDLPNDTRIITPVNRTLVDRHTD